MEPLRIYRIKYGELIAERPLEALLSGEFEAEFRSRAEDSFQMLQDQMFILCGSNEREEFRRRLKSDRRLVNYSESIAECFGDEVLQGMIAGCMDPFEESSQSDKGKKAIDAYRLASRGIEEKNFRVENYNGRVVLFESLDRESDGGDSTYEARLSVAPDGVTHLSIFDAFLHQKASEERIELDDVVLHQEDVGHCGLFARYKTGKAKPGVAPTVARAIGGMFYRVNPKTKTIQLYGESKALGGIEAGYYREKLVTIFQDYLTQHDLTDWTVIGE